jgi:putative flavoprotein involved in K+ transport
MTTDKADLIFASLPYAMLPEFQIPLYDEMKERDKDFYEGLEKAGFWLDWGADETGLFMKYLRRGSGYYIDVGASQLIIDGKIKLARAGHGGDRDRRQAGGRHRAARRCDRLRHRLRLHERLGGQDLMGPGGRRQGRQVLGPRLRHPKDPGPWEGEQRNMWKPTQQEALWFHGGNLHQSRHYSQFLSLQLKARQAGMPTPVYGLAEDKLDELGFLVQGLLQLSGNTGNDEPSHHRAINQTGCNFQG